MITMLIHIIDLWYILLFMSSKYQWFRPCPQLSIYKPCMIPILYKSLAMIVYCMSRWHIKKFPHRGQWDSRDQAHPWHAQQSPAGINMPTNASPMDYKFKSHWPYVSFYLATTMEIKTGRDSAIFLCNKNINKSRKKQCIAVTIICSNKNELK